MDRMISWLQHHEKTMFSWMNQKIHHFILNFILSRITHLGGATFTILCTCSIAVIAPRPWSLIGLESLVALAISHIPVAIIKKMYPRMRPYLVIPETRISKNPLADHSFPSGHTTAIFSVTIPFVLAFPWLAMILIPLAGVVGLSRIYLGLHYPSDCAAGCLIGLTASVLTVAFFH